MVGGTNKLQKERKDIRERKDSRIKDRSVEGKEEKGEKRKGEK